MWDVCARTECCRLRISKNRFECYLTSDGTELETFAEDFENVFVRWGTEQFLSNEFIEIFEQTRKKSPSSGSKKCDVLIELKLPQSAKLHETVVVTVCATNMSGKILKDVTLSSRDCDNASWMCLSPRIKLSKLSCVSEWAFLNSDSSKPCEANYTRRIQFRFSLWTVQNESLFVMCILLDYHACVSIYLSINHFYKKKINLNTDRLKKTLLCNSVLVLVGYFTVHFHNLNVG